MALDDAVKAIRRSLLAESLVPERFNNISLKKQGEAGAVLRDYMLTHYGNDAREGRGAIVVNRKPGLAYSFTRDIVIGGASVNVYYLQTFANRFSGDGFVMPQSFVIEWFEQHGVPSPFSPSERYRLETAISQMINDGLIFYIFTSVNPVISQWWSQNFIELLLDNSRLIEVSDAGERSNKRTPVRSVKEQGQENNQVAKRVSVR